jgi:site-specific DNA recombinase
MLTVAYCRVSTEEQATDGFSIEGQGDRLRAYADLHELGPVTIITDPGLSGKNLDRPGLQQLLSMVEDGHVAHVLIWRLDRLSRNLGDLIDLADTFGKADVALHSFTEKIDLSSATGRMFYNILGSFAQFYREQLAENVRLGMQQAGRQGRWTNHAPTGYDLVDGVLVPNGDAETVQRIYRLRSQGSSYADIERATGINHSTVLSILRNPAYQGLVKCAGEWLPGLHEPIISEKEFAAAHRGRNEGQRRGKDLMSGRVRCGGCGRSMSVMDNGAGWQGYRCWHRGKGCDVPRFSNKGLLKAALLPLRLISQDLELQSAIRAELERRTGARRDTGRRQSAQRKKQTELETKRRKLLELYYADQIPADLFAEEQRRITTHLAALEQSEPDSPTPADDLAAQFEQVAQLLASIDLDQIWEAATETERRTLLDEYISAVQVYGDHLEVEVRGAPKINVALHEVGLRNKNVEIAGVGGGT